MCKGGCLLATCICQSCVGPNRMVARYIYGILFLFTNILAWMVRDYSHKALSSFSNLSDCGGEANCIGSEGVLRLSLGCFVFFFTMYLTTVGTSRKDDPRDAWHAGWWPIKSVMWIVLVVVPFLIPSAFIQIYGEVARFGAGIFLIIQLLSIVNFVYYWNEDWLSEKNERRCRLPMVGVSATAYVLSLVGIVLMYVWFAPHATCGLNIFFITWTLILIIVMTAISLHSKVNAGLLTSSLMALYLVFLCWSAIMRLTPIGYMESSGYYDDFLGDVCEPLSATCNTRPRQTGRGDWLTVISFLIAFSAIIFATFTTGLDSASFSFSKDEGNVTDDKVPYSYGFFHFVFAMGSMYFAMLFVGWNLHQTMHRWSIDVGWSSTWVKIVNEWLAAGLYIWTMIGPFIFKGRDFT